MSINDDTIELSLPDPLPDDLSTPISPQIRVTAGFATHPETELASSADHFLISGRLQPIDPSRSSPPGGTLPTHGSEDLLMLAADGVGGESLAAIAHRWLLPTVWEFTGHVADTAMKSAQHSIQQLQERVDHFLDRIKQHLKNEDQGHSGRISTETRLAGAQLIGCDAVIVNIGDSRAYICRGKTCRQIDNDHAFGQALLDAGAASGGRDQPDSIFRDCFSIDESATTIPRLRHQRLTDRDWLLLSTDNLADYLSEDSIAETCHAHRKVQSACEALMAHAVKRGANPGFTLALAQFRDFRSPSPISPEPQG